MAAQDLSKPDQDDDLDSLLNYDINLPDALNGKETQLETSGTSQASKKATTGVDEEVKISKKRQPVPKLDQERLLSSTGIPRLRKVHKEKLKFKGKGHEFSDVAKLLNMYQLWLDDLYPRAKFADALLILEKLGHSKTIQMMRKQWINEGKPKSSMEDEEDMVGLDSLPIEGQASMNNGELHRTIEIRGKGQSGGDLTTADSTDLIDKPTALQSGDVPDLDEMDELDALLAEQEAPPRPEVGNAPARPLSKPSQTMQEEDDFADEMEAMAGMDVPW